MEKRCAFFLAKKNRFCANAPLKESSFCGNHNLRVEEEEERVICPIDSSHSILRKNLDAHLKKCPLHKHTLALEALPYYNKGINSGGDDEEHCNCGVGNGFCYLESASAVADDESEKKCCSNPLDRECSQISSEMKRNAIYKMHVLEFCALLEKIKSIYTSLDVRLEESVIVPEAEAGGRSMKRQPNREIPFQEKHALQQASILGNMELSEILQRNLHPGPENAVESSEKCENEIVHPAVVEFGAGRGYLTHMLTDCYGIKKVYLVERRSYKLKLRI